MYTDHRFSHAKALIVATIVGALIFGQILPQTANVAEAQTGGQDSTMMLQMPFMAGQSWMVGGQTCCQAGSWYGQGQHTGNDYYATDWNRTGDAGSAVLPVAEGTVIKYRGTAEGGGRVIVSLGSGTYAFVVSAA